MSRRAFIKRTSHEFRTSRTRHDGGRYALTFAGELVASADEPTQLYRLAESLALEVEPKDAWLSVLGNDEFEVTLLHEGLIVGCQFADGLREAAEILNRWQGPLTDRRARYSVRRPA